MTGSCLAYYVDRLSPFLFRFGHGLGLRYYGLAYVLGFLIAYAGLRWQVRLGLCRLNEKQADDLALVAIPLGVIVGGRLGYCFLYDLPQTLHRPWSILEVWQGGMASHGGILGVIVVMLWTARRHGIPFYNIADAAALCTPLALGLGRIANFINGELWGRPATVPWAVLFPKAPDGGLIPRHPSQLYEAGLEGLLLFLILLIVRLNTKREGAVALTFVGAYGLVRIAGECFREPDVQIGYYLGAITQGQLLSVLLIVAALVLAWFQFARRPAPR